MARPRPVRGHPPPALVTGANGSGALLRGVKSAAQSHRTLAQQFLWDLQEHWQLHGRAALDTMAKERPDLYVQMVAKLVPVHQIELGGPGDFRSATNREELLERVGERFGEQGRAMFERFMAQLDQLRQQQERQTDD
jgi:hypothetical protein